MKEQNVSKSYANAVYQLATEANVDVAKELTSLTDVINKSNDLETLLFLDAFTVEEKSSVLVTVMEKLNLSSIVKNFLNFLLAEKRINILPLIIKDIIVLDDHKKGFLRGTIEGADETVNEEFKAKIKAYLKSEAGIDAELDYVKTDKVTAGYRVTVEDLQLDASLDNQLNKFKDSILNS